MAAALEFVQIEVAPISTAACHSREVAYISISTVVPDSQTLFTLPVLAGAFTKSKLDFVFKDGTPVSMSSDQPSQLAALARLPVDILKAMLEVPTSLIKLRIDYDNQGASLTDAQTKQLKAQLDLLKAQQALKAAQDAESSSSP